ncbi:putative pyruvate dehydrogenase complex component Pdx1 [Talaromyces proteolyticus]|uniref:Pyruvate dehydrogenase complex component Pdx1 n=1 Tax=Talaromyces proteolyticus TaxID=1131652 RepID=A0AAD4KM21_9EURO|nr:putative pyruvate dehydrogenase complex component Pdx1 [Talaromyces proteolyticus]KAH8694131.1 putative pyruvate dehydrogenase complex component Pdx1 [Talaromyces proteolyticus]
MASILSFRQVPLGIARRQVKVNYIAKPNTASQTQSSAYPLYPSVAQLLHQKGVPDSEVSKIPATGPKGRLLKGDVLAYLGTIKADYPAEQAARLAKMAHLDLSNIKIAAPPAPPKPAVEESLPELPSDISVAASISLKSVLSTQKRIQETIGVTIPLSTFIARATDLANDDLPRSSLSQPSASELFDEVLGTAPIKFTRGSYIPEINAVPMEEFETYEDDVFVEEEDIIDILAGNTTSAPKRTAALPEKGPLPAALNVFSVTVPAGEEQRARTFLDRLNTILTADPGRLVL